MKESDVEILDNIEGLVCMYREKLESKDFHPELVKDLAGIRTKLLSMYICAFGYN